MTALSPSSSGASQALLAALLDETSEALLWFDGHDVLRQCNQAALRLLGCEIGQGLVQLRAPLGELGERWLRQARDSGERRDTLLQAARKLLAGPPAAVRKGDAPSWLIAAERRLAERFVN